VGKHRLHVWKSKLSCPPVSWVPTGCPGTGQGTAHLCWGGLATGADGWAGRPPPMPPKFRQWVRVPRPMPNLSQAAGWVWWGCQVQAGKGHPVAVGWVAMSRRAQVLWWGGASWGPCSHKHPVQVGGAQPGAQVGTTTSPVPGLWVGNACWGCGVGREGPSPNRAVVPTRVGWGWGWGGNPTVSVAGPQPHASWAVLQPTCPTANLWPWGGCHNPNVGQGCWGTNP